MKRFITTLLLLLFPLVVWAANDFQLFLVSPERKSVIIPEELLLVVALQGNTQGLVDNHRIKVFLDAQDITARCTITPTYVRFVPDAAFLESADALGPHKLTVRAFDQDGMVVDEVNVFCILARSQDFVAYTRSKISQRKNEGSVTINQRYERRPDGEQAVTDGYITYTTSKGAWYFTSRLYMVSDETQLAQPQSHGRIEWGCRDKFMFALGDHFPNYHPYVLAGQRVRGVEMNYTSYNRGFKTMDLDIVYGLARMGSKNFGFTGEGIEDIGLYKRRLLAINPKAGSGNHIQAGLILLKAKDDVHSITLQVVDSTGMVKYGSTPKDNLVLGGNVMVPFWKKRITLFGNYAFGIYTDDIRGGILTKEQAENLGLSEDQYPGAFLQRHAGKIIINSSTSLLSTSGEAFINSSVYDWGVRLALPLKTLNSTTEFKYLRLGPKYRSFGQENLGSSRKGFRVSERLRLWKNRVTFSGAFGLYENNLDHLAATATQMRDYTVSAFYTAGPRYPTLSLHYTNIASENINVDSILTQQNTNATVGFTTAYRISLGQVQNNLNLYLSNNRFQAMSQTRSRASTGGLNLTTRYGRSPVSTQMRVDLNSTGVSTDTRYYAVSGGLRYDIVPQRLSVYGSGGSVLYEQQPVSNWMSSLTLDWQIVRNFDLTLYGELKNNSDMTSSYLSARCYYGLGGQ
jgi:hypothetical protein